VSEGGDDSILRPVDTVDINDFLSRNQICTESEATSGSTECTILVQDNICARLSRASGELSPADDR